MFLNKNISTAFKSIITIAFCGLLSLSSSASDDLSIPELVEAKCMTCHTSATIIDAPFMAGQKKEFLEWELFNFRDKVRVHEIMNTAMEGLSDSDISEMAEYISNLSLCEAQADVDDHSDADINNGERIFLHSCKQCHLNNPSGIGPVLHGQKTSYMEFAIKSFRFDQESPRPSKVDMGIYVQGLTNQEIKDIAAYLNVQKLCGEWRDQ